MQRKIINDPVHGFITIDDELIFNLINHPYYQRLRRIQQMALAHLVYPGAVHTRLHHSLGAYHLMRFALFELKLKGIAITAEEETAAKIAILLHDIGHGPYSHALEGILMPKYHHEELSLAIMHQLNATFEGRLGTAISIFTNAYPKKFLHQLVSGQLDVDRLDYLARDSFFTGVTEGAIGYDRILKMITVVNDNLVIEEKAIFSVEKFLLARRLMYWQVYLHKTVVAAEQMLRNIINRAKQINAESNSIYLNKILYHTYNNEAELINHFCTIDDTDVMGAIKHWSLHNDYVLATLCTSLINRKLYKIQFVQPSEVAQKLQVHYQQLSTNSSLTQSEYSYLAFSGTLQNNVYSSKEEGINILYKNGTINDISAVSHGIVSKTSQSQNTEMELKYYICYLPL